MKTWSHSFTSLTSASISGRPATDAWYGLLVTHCYVELARLILLGAVEKDTRLDSAISDEHTSPLPSSFCSLRRKGCLTRNLAAIHLFQRKRLSHERSIEAPE